MGVPLVPLPVPGHEPMKAWVIHRPCVHGQAVNNHLILRAYTLRQVRVRLASCNSDNLALSFGLSLVGPPTGQGHNRLLFLCGLPFPQATSNPLSKGGGVSTQQHLARLFFFSALVLLPLRLNHAHTVTKTTFICVNQSGIAATKTNWPELSLDNTNQPWTTQPWDKELT